MAAFSALGTQTLGSALCLGVVIKQQNCQLKIKRKKEVKSVTLSKLQKRLPVYRASSSKTERLLTGPQLRNPAWWLKFVTAWCMSPNARRVLAVGLQIYMSRQVHKQNLLLSSGSSPDPLLGKGEGIPSPGQGLSTAAGPGRFRSVTMGHSNVGKRPTTTRKPSVIPGRQALALTLNIMH